MAGSTTNLDTISSSQAAKEVSANALFDAASPASLFGRRASTTAGLSWGYYGGCLNVAGTPTQIANGTVALTGSATNYVEATTAGVVSANTSAFTGGRLQLYTVVCGASAVTSYIDHRSGATGAGIAGAIGSGDVVGPAAAVSNRVAFFDGTTGKLIKDSGLTLSGSNTGDQSSVSGNAGTATALASARTIGGVSFDGTADITQPFDVMTFYPGVPTASAKLYRGKIARAVTFAANFAGSYFTGSANATASTVFDIQKNGSSIGSCTIGAGGVTPTFASTGGSAQSFAAGDILMIVAPASPDATLADPAITLVGAR